MTADVCKVSQCILTIVSYSACFNRAGQVRLTIGVGPRHCTTYTRPLTFLPLFLIRRLFETWIWIWEALYSPSHPNIRTGVWGKDLAEIELGAF